MLERQFMLYSCHYDAAGENPLSAQYDLIKIDLQPSEQYKSVSQLSKQGHMQIVYCYVHRWYWLDCDQR